MASLFRSTSKGQTHGQETTRLPRIRGGAIYLPSSRLGCGEAGIQPVAEALGYELPTAATLILVFWVQALAAGNVWQGYGKD